MKKKNKGACTKKMIIYIMKKNKDICIREVLYMLPSILWLSQNCHNYVLLTSNDNIIPSCMLNH